MWNNDEIAKARAIAQAQAQQSAMDRYAQQKEAIDSKYKSAPTGLAGLLSNLTRDAKAVGNTLATTGAAIASPFIQGINNTRQEANRDATQNYMDAIAQKYGYANKDDAYDKGDGPEEMWKEFQDAANASRKVQDQISEDFKNNAAVKKINDTKQSQFGADAIRTLSAGAQVAGLGLTPVGAAATGALGGVADSLENANGTLLDVEALMSGGKIKNTQDTSIDMGDLAKRAGIGAVAGGVAGGLAGKIGNATSGIGSKLLNNRFATSAIGRGALVGGAAGGVAGGLGAGLEGGDIASGVIQGAGSGAITGGLTSGITSGARKVGTALTDKLGITDNIAAARNRLIATDATKPRESRAVQNKTATVEEPENLNGFRTKTARERLADATERTGEFLEGVQASLNRTDKKNISVKNTGKVVNNIRKKTGLTTIQDQADFAKQITGGPDSILDKYQRNALAYREDGKPFMAETSDIYEKIPEIVKKNITSAATSANRPNQLIDNFRQDLRDNSGDLLGLANRYKASAAAARRSSSAAEQAEAQVFETMARAIDDASYSAIPKANVEAMFDASIDELRSRANLAQNAGDKKTAKAYSTAALELDKQPRTIQAFRTFKKDFVDAANINDKVIENDNTGSTNTARGIRGWANTAKDLILEKPVKYGAAKVGSFLSAQAENIRNGGKTPTSELMPTNTAITPDMQNMYSILGLNIGRNEGTQAQNEAIKANEYKTLEQQLAQTMDASGDYGPIAQPQMAQGGTTAGADQLTTISNAMNAALSAGDITAYNQLANLYKTAYEMKKLQTGTTEKQTKLSETQQKANAAEEILNQLETMNPDYGYTVRDIPVLNLVNAGGNAYSSTADSLATQLGYMMSGATVTPAEYERIKQQYVPQPWDSEEQRRYKLQQARNVIARYQQGYEE